jgi:Fe-Mn family superoxide dismutase
MEKSMNRREITKIFGIATLASVAAPAILQSAAQAQTAPPATPATPATPIGPYTLPPLGYAFDALEPHIDAMTMRIHHDNHHQTYVNNLNALAPKMGELTTKPIPEVLAAISSVPEDIRGPVRNNLGGHWNHSFFWEIMAPGGAKEPAGDLKAAIDAEYGSFGSMSEKLTQSGIARFGSGWAWLAVGKDKKLAIFNTPYQDTPHMEMAARGAVIGIDVWEHAYYLKHQSRRADYVKAWWNTVNWDKAAANFKAATA